MAAGGVPLILSETHLGRFRLTGGPKPRPGIAVVLFGASGAFVELLPGQPMTPGERFYGNYTAYEVDVTSRTLEVRCTLATKDAAYSFTVTGHVRYCVQSPAVVVKRQLKDPEEALLPLVQRTLRRVSQQFEADQTAAAEEAMEKAVTQEDYGLGLRMEDAALQLGLDSAALEHARRREEIRRQAEITEAASTAQHHAQVADLQHQRELERAKKPVLDEAAEHKWQRESKFIERYAPLIEQEQWKLLLVLLASEPEALREVISQLDERQQRTLAAQMKAFEIALRSDHVEEYELNEPARRLVVDMLEGFRSSIANRPPPLPQGTHREAPAVGPGKQAPETEAEQAEVKDPDAEEEEQEKPT